MYKGFSDFSVGENQSGVHNTSYEIHGDVVQISDAAFIRDADMTRDGMDLVLKHDGETVTVKGYYAAETTPTLVGSDGSHLTPQLVDSFIKTPAEYAQNHAINDESPVGHVQELSGKATITHTDGSTSEISIGTPVYEGDIIETADSGALNIKFADETTFAVSENARLAIDEYVYDPETNEGSTDFSVLKGVFVFTSGLIGREDPDDVTIDTPMGSIGIRGTIIAGDVNSGEITVVEGAIVLHDPHGNEVTLANQFETAKFDSAAGKIEHMGELSADDVTAKFAGVSEVSGSLFSSINDAAKDSGETQSVTPETQKAAEPETKTDTQEKPAADKEAAVKDVQPEVKAETKEAAIEKTIQVLDERANDIENKLMQNQTAARENIVDMKAATQTVNDLTQALQDRATQLADMKSKIAPEPVKSGFGEPPINPIHKSGGGGGGNNHPTVALTDGAPTGFFKTYDGQTWSYDFSKEFKDVDGDNLTFTLSSTTLNALSVSGISHNFANGVLTLTNVPGSGSIPIVVSATDGKSAAVSFSKNLSLVTPDDVLTDGAGGNNNDTVTQILVEDSLVTSELDTGARNKTIFMDQNGIGEFTVNGQNNTIYVGESSRDVYIGNNASGNTIYGGSGSDRFEIHHGKNTIHGIGGDDVVVMNLSETSLTGNLANLVIDLDSGLKSYSQAYAKGGAGALNGGGLTPGDALELNGTGTLDLTMLGTNNLKGIETIQARNMTGGQTVILNFEKVFGMTEDHHTLLFQGDTGDNLNLKNSVTWNQGTPAERVTIGADQYDVWSATDGNGKSVTILVDTDVSVQQIA